MNDRDGDRTGDGRANHHVCEPVGVEDQAACGDDEGEEGRDPAEARVHGGKEQSGDDGEGGVAAGEAPELGVGRDGQVPGVDVCGGAGGGGEFDGVGAPGPEDGGGVAELGAGAADEPLHRGDGDADEGKGEGVVEEACAAVGGAVEQEDDQRDEGDGCALTELLEGAPLAAEVAAEPAAVAGALYPGFDDRVQGMEDEEGNEAAEEDDGGEG